MIPRGIVLHLTASTYGDAAEIDQWHKQNGWSGIGYHRVVLNGRRKHGSPYNPGVDGLVESGRALNVMGAHCKADRMNHCTLGISCVGTPNVIPAGATPAPAGMTTSPYLTGRQFASLVSTAAQLCARFGLDPDGTFVHPTTGRTHRVISQHSEHEPGKPSCASLRIDAVRAAITAELARLTSLQPIVATAAAAEHAVWADAGDEVSDPEGSEAMLPEFTGDNADPDGPEDLETDVAPESAAAVAYTGRHPRHGVSGLAASDSGPGAPDDDSLRPEQVERIKYDIWSTPTPQTFASASPHARVVAEGDSWFDYLPGLDILDQLKRDHGYEIFKVARAGDTLENMVYGTGIGENFSRQVPPIRTTFDAVRQFQPAVFLFSGGGNDIAGPELEALLNHKDSALPVIRESYVEYLYTTAVKRAYAELIRLVTDAKPDIQIVVHGYAEPVPDGRPVRVLGFRFAGPWLRPGLTKKGIVDATEARGVMRQLMARFNQMLAELDAEHENFHYVDLRNDIGVDDWANELHPKNSAFGRAARRLHEKIQAVTSVTTA